VSARTISFASRRSASATTSPSSTSPSNGQPKATEIVTVTGSVAAPRIASTCVSASSRDISPLRRLKLSVAPRVTLTRSSPDAAKRS